jgi:hypothetical protein
MLADMELGRPKAKTGVGRDAPFLTLFIASLNAFIDSLLPIIDRDLAHVGRLA